MRKLALLAVLAFAATSPAQAAFEVSVNSVAAYGTRTLYANSSTDCGRPLYVACPDVVTPYSITVTDVLEPNIADLDGEFTLFGQDRFRSGFTVNLLFSGGNLITSSLTGEAVLNAPTDALDFATFAASNFAVTVRDTNTGITRLLAPVPEPSTWAMMLAGFAGIGLALRRRRRNQVAYA